MPNRYPQTVAEVIDPNIRYRPEALLAVKLFATAKPWRGTIGERKKKFRRLNRELAAAYGIEKPRLEFDDVEADRSSASSSYDEVMHQITLCGRLSVVTFLHEFAHALGKDERQACRWSINLFKRCFPISFERCLAVGHMLWFARTAQEVALWLDTCTPEERTAWQLERFQEREERSNPANG